MGKYKVVLLKTIFPDTKVEEEMLKEISADLILSPSADEDTVIQHISDANAIVTPYVQVTEKILEAARRCKVVVQTGIGVDAIDVMEEELPKANEPLLTLDNVIITAHTAYYSEASEIELRKQSFRKVVRVLNGGKPKNLVNRKEIVN